MFNLENGTGNKDFPSLWEWEGMNLWTMWQKQIASELSLCLEEEENPVAGNPVDLNQTKEKIGHSPLEMVEMIELIDAYVPTLFQIKLSKSFTKS